jgi:hypothetical protein
MKQYLVFVFDQFYPLGGWDDFVGSYDSIEEARRAALKRQIDVYQIVDGQTGIKVEHQEVP